MWLIYFSIIADKIPRSTLGISAVCSTRNARPGNCFGTLMYKPKLISRSLATKSTPRSSSLPRRLSSLADTDKRRLDFWMAVHCTLKVFYRYTITRKVCIRDRNNKVIIWSVRGCLSSENMSERDISTSIELRYFICSFQYCFHWSISWWVYHIAS